MANEPKEKPRRDQAHGLDQRIDLNHASKDDLMSIPGISQQAAEDILHFRDENGGFENWGDLDQIPLPMEDLDKLRPHVRL